MQEEIWKDIPNYEGMYQVSNLGGVKSLSREICNGYGCFKSKEKILNPREAKGYLRLGLSKNSEKLFFSVHQLVAMAFLGHTPCGHKLVVDHINDNPLDNRVENLQVVTQRYNAYKTQDKYSSKYKGVHWCETINKWKSRIIINKKRIYLGSFNCEISAHLAYQNKLKEIFK